MTNPDDEIRSASTHHRTRLRRAVPHDAKQTLPQWRRHRRRAANYIYAYPPEQELEVERRIPMLVNRLQSMDPVDSNDSAPGVLVIDLYKTVIHIMQSDDILESVIGQEAEMHGGENADNTDGDSDEWPHLQEDDFYQALAGMFDADAGELKDALANQYRDAAAERESRTSCFSPASAMCTRISARTPCWILSRRFFLPAFPWCCSSPANMRKRRRPSR